jgi:hypothetical protein
MPTPGRDRKGFRRDDPAGDQRGRRGRDLPHVRSVANIPAADYARYIAPSELALLSAANASATTTCCTLRLCGTETISPPSGTTRFKAVTGRSRRRTSACWRDEALPRQSADRRLCEHKSRRAVPGQPGGDRSGDGSPASAAPGARASSSAQTAPFHRIIPMSHLEGYGSAPRRDERFSNQKGEALC